MTPKPKLDPLGNAFSDLLESQGHRVIDVGSEIPEKNTKLIPLRNGLFTKVDKDDFNIFSVNKWFVDKCGYVVRQKYKNKKMTDIKLHRVIMGAKKGEFIDHINGNPLDNRKSNLRLCNKSQNNWNSKIRIDNTSGYKGVSVNIGHPGSKKIWQAMIQVYGKRKFLGCFYTKEEAAQAYNVASSIFHGQFSRPNILDAPPTPPVGEEWIRRYWSDKTLVLDDGSVDWLGVKDFIRTEKDKSWVEGYKACGGDTGKQVGIAYVGFQEKLDEAYEKGKKDLGGEYQRLIKQAEHSLWLAQDYLSSKQEVDLAMVGKHISMAKGSLKKLLTQKKGEE